MSVDVHLLDGGFAGRMGRHVAIGGVVRIVGIIESFSKDEKGGRSLLSAKLSELIKQVDRGDINLVAGKGGYSNQVEWVHMVDNTEIAEFLVGGEVAFTTGIGIREDMTLLDLVKGCYRNKASGIVINVGPYIPKITPEIIEFGDAHDFPIFEVPWHVHMADIMRMFCFTITRSEQRIMELSTAFRYAIFAPKQEELYVPMLMQRGYFAEWNYVAAIIDICDRLKSDNDIFYKPVLEERMKMFLKKASVMIGQKKQNAIVFQEKDKIVAVLSDISEEEAAGIIEAVKKQLVELTKSTETIFAGVGSTSHNIRCLSESYLMAKRIIDLSKMEHRELETRSYQDMGIYSLLFHIDGVECMEVFYEKTIKPLSEHDANIGSNLVEVLECYLKSNGSLQDTAEELFVHRNTINYRIKKIEAILGVDLTSFEVRNQLALGLMVEKVKRIFLNK